VRRFSIGKARLSNSVARPLTDVHCTYIYDENARLIGVMRSTDHIEREFHYDGSSKTELRRIQPRAGQQSHATGFSIIFGSSIGGRLIDGWGVVETKYNELDQPIEMRVLDDEAIVVYRIEYVYDTPDRLSEEKLITENPSIPKTFRDQIPIEHRHAFIGEMKAKFREDTQGLFGDTVRTYTYDEKGRIAERHMRMGPMREDLTFSYNEHGEISELARQQSGFPDASMPATQIALKILREYEYDSFGNWTRIEEKSEFGGNSSSHIVSRQLTYYLYP
jgi:hypothetical protein